MMIARTTSVTRVERLFRIPITRPDKQECLMTTTSSNGTHSTILVHKIIMEKLSSAPSQLNKTCTTITPCSLCSALESLSQQPSEVPSNRVSFRHFLQQSTTPCILHRPGPRPLPLLLSSLCFSLCFSVCFSVCFHDRAT